MAESTPAKASDDSIRARAQVDPILRNALRYTISAKEYQTLHRYVISRSKVLKRNAPAVSQVERDRDKKDDYNAAAVRASLRVFIGSAAGLKAWDLISPLILGRDRKRGVRTSFWVSPNFRLSLSLSSILLLHRILFRFFTRLRASLLDPSAAPFRRRNPRFSRTLTCSLAPAIGASLAGFMLGVYPNDQLRLTIVIYTLSRAAEFLYNLAENEGWIWNKFDRPWWWGSWMLFPLTSGQLLHAFIIDRDCFPKPYGDFILSNSPEYIHPRPVDYPSHLRWPERYDIIDGLATIAQQNYPPFISPILFPNTVTPASLTAIAPLTSTAHPLITSLTCATIHPHDPSCLRTYITYWIRVFPRLTKFFAALLTLMSIPKYKSFYNSPISSLNSLSSRILRASATVSGAIGTSWASFCLFQALLSPKTLPTQRYFFSGFIGGLWGFINRKHGRGAFLYSARASIGSLWNVGRKRGWWKGVRGGDVWVFVASLAVANVVFERDSSAVNSNAIRGVLASLRGQNLSMKKD